MKIPKIENNLLYIIIIIVIVIFVIGGKLASAMKYLLSFNWLKDSNQAAGEDKVKLVDNSIKKSNLTISETTAQNIADNLFNAMNDAGTNELAIYKEFERISTTDDMKLVYTKFGVKKYSWYGQFFLGEFMDLNQWLHEELNVQDLAPITNKLNWL
jgi:hypothetical protein